LIGWVGLVGSASGGIAIYRRKAVPANNIQGDQRLLDFWLDHVGFE
jgi:hypothetical protein